MTRWEVLGIVVLDKGSDMSIRSTLKSAGSTPQRQQSLVHVVLFFLLVMILFLLYQIFRFRDRAEYAVHHPLVLGDPSKLPVRLLAANSYDLDETNTSCSHFGCFNVYRCGTQGNKLQVYVYPLEAYVDANGNAASSTMTREFYQILEAIIGSKFYTPNPREACVLVPSIDTLNQNRVKVQHVSQALKMLP